MEPITYLARIIQLIQFLIILALIFYKRGQFINFRVRKNIRKVSLLSFSAIFLILIVPRFLIPISSPTEYPLKFIFGTELTTNVKADLNSDAYFFYKRIFNQYRLKKLADILKDSLKPKAIVLLGSYANARDTEESAVKILILSDSKGNITGIKDLEKELHRKILLNISPSLNEQLKKELVDCIVLHGSLDEKRWNQ